jgi:hypothetical protein
MIPSYPFTVLIEYRPSVNRKPVTKLCETLELAMAIYTENIGRQDVYRITISLVIHQALARPLRAKNY